MYKVILIHVSFFVTVNFCIGQSLHENISNRLIGKWGEIDNITKKYKGKTGLTRLDLNKDSTYYAYIYSDWGGFLYQTGYWIINENRVIFQVKKQLKFDKSFKSKTFQLINLNYGKIEYYFEIIEGDLCLIGKENIESNWIKLNNSTPIPSESKLLDNLKKLKDDNNDK